MLRTGCAGDLDIHYAVSVFSIFVAFFFSYFLFRGRFDEKEDGEACGRNRKVSTISSAQTCQRQ